MKPTFGSKLIPYKIVDFEGHDSKRYADLMSLNFCTHIRPISTLNPPNSLIGMTSRGTTNGCTQRLHGQSSQVSVPHIYI